MEKQTTNLTPALYYHPDGYETSRANLMGRHAAGESFLRAIAQYAPDDTLHCYAYERKHFEHFAKKIGAHSSMRRKCTWIELSNWRNVQQAGGIFMPSPTLGWLAWQRRHMDQRAYSLCGVTHTTATQRVLDALGELVTAPLQPWDALICTSQSVKTMVMHVLNNYGDYLKDRFAMTSPPKLHLQLPVVPLGINCREFDLPEDQRLILRDRWRGQLKIEQDEFTVLFVGRLSFQEKAHPLPLYLSLEQATQQSGKKFHLIMSGWFPNQNIAKQFIEGAKAFCPSVKVSFVDGRQAAVRRTIWFAADAFVSLSDNVQETFGLTPIEAMAAGLPVVVSDWDGYKETVRDGIDGFRIASWMPPPGFGTELALQNAIGVNSYEYHVGCQSQFASIDIAACASAFERLASNPALCRQMAESARARARAVFDWSVVLKQYYAIWQGLADLRGSSTETVRLIGNAPPNPLRDDPCSVFSNYPTHTISPTTIVAATNLTSVEQYERLIKFGMNTYAGKYLLSDAEFRQLLARLSHDHSLTVQDLCAAVPMLRGRALLYSLGWLSKMGLLQLDRLVLEGVESRCHGYTKEGSLAGAK